MDKRSYLSLLAGFGSSAAIFSSAFVLVFVVKLFSQGRTSILYLLGFALAAIAGWASARYALQAAARLEPAVPAGRSTPPKPRAPLPGQVMLLARAAEGRLSATEVAAATGLTVDASREVLEELIREGVAELWLNDDGGYVYVFPELFKGFKNGAKSPLAR